MASLNLWRFFYLTRKQRGAFMNVCTSLRILLLFLTNFKHRLRGSTNFRNFSIKYYEKLSGRIRVFPYSEKAGSTRQSKSMNTPRIIKVWFSVFQGWSSRWHSKILNWLRNIFICESKVQVLLKSFEWS